jgi:hypothetical protein
MVGGADCRNPRNYCAWDLDRGMLLALHNSFLELLRFLTMAVDL